MLRHLAEIASVAACANIAINRIRERSDDLQERRLARNFES
jgi:hypothetical protein